MRKLSFAEYAALALLSGCANNPSLDEQLSGKSASQRQVILTKACHSEAGKGKDAKTSSSFGYHVQKMHKICSHIEQEFTALKSSSGE